MATIRNSAKERPRTDERPDGTGVALAVTVDSSGLERMRECGGMGPRMILAGIGAGMLMRAGQGRTTGIRGCP